MNKVIKCINSKSYSITVGNEYKVLDETEDLYLIKNDNNNIVKYGKSLFEQVNSVEEIVVPAPIPAPIPFYTLNEIKNSLNITNYEDYDDVSTNGNNSIGLSRIEIATKTGTIINIGCHISLIPREVSCGVYDICDINSQYSSIRTSINEIQHLTESEKEQLINYIFAKCIMNLILESEVNLFNISTNTCYLYFDNIKEVIESFNNVHSFTAHNPNSSNEIILWTLNMS